MNWDRRLVWGFAACMLGAGCSDDDDGDGAGAGTFSSFVNSVARAYCERLYRCNEASDDAIATKILLGNPDRCTSGYVAWLARSAEIRDLQQKLADQRLRYDRSGAERCLAEMASCFGSTWFGGPGCRDVFTGTTQVGGACERHEDCAGDAYCDLGASCPGVCRQRKAAGDDCDLASECSDSSGSPLCDAQSGLTSCVVRSDVAGADEGEPCSLMWEYGGSPHCRDGLWCDIAPDSSTSEGTCRAVLPASAACDNSSDVCQLGEYCDTSRNKCVPVTLHHSVNDACDDFFVICDPLEGLACVEGKCVRGGDGSSGSKCYENELKPPCDAGLRCVLSDDPSSQEGTCEALLEAGSTCSTNSECKSGTCQDVCFETYCGYYE